MEYIFPAVLAALSAGVSLMAFRFPECHDDTKGADEQTAKAPDNSIPEQSGTAGKAPRCLKLPTMTPKRWVWLATWALLAACGGYFRTTQGGHWTLLAEYAVSVLALGAAGLIDGEIKKIPNRLVLCYLAAGGILLLTKCLTNPADWPYCLLTAGVGLLGCFLIFMLMALLTKGGIGMGDVKLIAAIGFHIGLTNALFSVLLGMILCMLVSIILLFTGKKKMKDDMPFGPFIFLGYIAIVILETLI